MTGIKEKTYKKVTHIEGRSDRFRPSFFHEEERNAAAALAAVCLKSVPVCHLRQTGTGSHHI